MIIYKPCVQLETIIVFSDRQVSIIFTFCFDDLDSRVALRLVARCHAHSTVRTQLYSALFCGGERTWCSCRSSLCVVFNVFLVWKYLLSEETSLFLTKSVFIIERRLCMCSSSWKSLHLRNRWWDSMSINLSVVFYGKGVPRRACTCSRRVGTRGQDGGW